MKLTKFLDDARMLLPQSAAAPRLGCGEPGARARAVLT